MRNPNVTRLLTTTSYTYYKIQKLLFNIVEVYKNFIMAKSGLQLNFKITLSKYCKIQQLLRLPTYNALVLGDLREYRHK